MAEIRERLGWGRAVSAKAQLSLQAASLPSASPVATKGGSPQPAACEQAYNLVSVPLADPKGIAHDLDGERAVVPVERSLRVRACGHERTSSKAREQPIDVRRERLSLGSGQVVLMLL